MYCVNDIVIYGLHGVCKISDITNKNIDGKLIDYYILKPIYDENSTISIPVENDTLTKKMRPPFTREELKTLIQELPEENDIWIENETARVKYYREALSNADLKELLILFKALIQRKKEQENIKKKLHNIDERFLKSIESVLLNEFSYVLNLEQEEIETLIAKKVLKEAI